MGGAHVCVHEEVARFGSVGSGLYTLQQSHHSRPLLHAQDREHLGNYGLCHILSIFDIARGFYEVPLEPSDMDKRRFIHTSVNSGLQSCSLDYEMPPPLFSILLTDC